MKTRHTLYLVLCITELLRTLVHGYMRNTILVYLVPARLQCFVCFFSVPRFKKGPRAAGSPFVPPNVLVESVERSKAEEKKRTLTAAPSIHFIRTPRVLRVLQHYIYIYTGGLKYLNYKAVEAHEKQQPK